MEIKKKQILQIILILLVLPILSAVTINTGTTFNNSVTGTNITCLNTYYAEPVIINASGTTFNRFNRDNSYQYISFNVNESNKNYLCSNLPYISSPAYFYSESVDTTTYTIPSGLSSPFTATIFFNNADCFTQVGNTLKLNGNSVNYTCLNGNITLTSTLSNGNNEIVISYNKQPQAGGGGGGGGFVPTLNVTNRLCELTYPYAENKTYNQIYDLIDIYHIETNKTESYTDIQTIINDWQNYCSDKINKTLFEPYVCNKLYYFVLNNDLDLASLNNLRNDIKPKIELSLNLIYSYLNNYNERCYLKGYSGKLSNEQLKINITLPEESKNCSIDFNSDIFNFYLPIGSWNLGVFDSCGSLDFWKYIFAFKTDNGSFYLIGLRLYLIVLVLLIIGVLSLYRLSKNKPSLNL